MALLGKIRPCFADDNCKVDAATYARRLKFDVFPQINRLAKMGGRKPREACSYRISQQLKHTGRTIIKEPKKQRLY